MRKGFMILLVSIFIVTLYIECKARNKISDNLITRETFFYVSPNISKSPAKGTREFPFNSLEQARDAIRKCRNESVDKDSRYRVVLLSGNYRITNSFTLTDKDSGTLNAPIIFEGEKNSKVILNGGINIPLESCTKITRYIKGYDVIPSEYRNQVYCVDLNKLFPEIKQSLGSIKKNRMNSYFDPLELCINGEMMTPARYPNIGFAKTGMNLDSITFRFDDERISRWGNEISSMVLGYLKNGWSFSFNKISAINMNEKTITLLESPKYGLKNDQPFYLSNLLSELDAPKEYYIDYQSLILYLILPQGIEISKSTLELSNIGAENKSIIEIDNTTNITFRNITFTLSRYGAINIKNSNGIILSDLVIHNIGNFGIMATGINNRFQNLHILDTGGTGISLSGGDRQNLTSSNNIIENCEIERTGRIQRTYHPAISLAGVGNVIRNCKISDLPHAAILFSGNDNLIEKNEIFHVCYETSDAGAIYTGRDWGSQGNIIQYNYIHDINSINKKEGRIHAIYLDDCASGISIKDNIIYNIGAVGILIGGGRDNNVTGNIITKCGSAAIHTDMRGKKRITLKKNDSWNLKEKIEKLNYKSEIWSKKYPKLSTIFDHGFEESKLPYGCKIMNNVMWNNKTNFIERGSGINKYITVSNNAELKVSPFSTENIRKWKFDSVILSVLPNGFDSIPISEIGLFR